jgi:hypothetical protein
VRSCLGVGWSDIVDGSLVKARVEGEEVLGEGNVVTVGGGHLKKEVVGGGRCFLLVSKGLRDLW